MSALNKILTVKEEGDVDKVYYKIYAWYAEELDKHKEHLPPEELAIARVALNSFLDRAKRSRNFKDLKALEQQYKEIIWFMLPWRVTLWYSFMKKEKKTETKKSTLTIKRTK